MESLYFGESNKKLYGVYHEAEKHNSKNTGIVLCYPFGEEYLRTHRTLKILSDQLSSNGYEVLRFDYYGTGDSYGSLDNEIDLDVWVENIKTAVDELREGANVKSIILMGVLLGANLVLALQEKYSLVEKLIIWNPILDGKNYLNLNYKLFHNWIKGSFIKKSLIDKNEIFGVIVPNKLKEDILSINLKNIKFSKKSDILLIEGNEYNIPDLYIDELKGKSLNMMHITVQDNDFWVKKSNQANDGIPVNALKTIISTIENF